MWVEELGAEWKPSNWQIPEQQNEINFQDSFAKTSQ